MSAVSELPDFDRLREKADGCLFFGEPLTSLSKDELLVAFVVAVEGERRHAEMFRDAFVLRGDALRLRGAA